MSLKNTLFLCAAALSLVACAQMQPAAKPPATVTPVAAERYEGMKFDGAYVGTPEATDGGWRAAKVLIRSKPGTAPDAGVF